MKAIRKLSNFALWLASDKEYEKNLQKEGYIKKFIQKQYLHKPSGYIGEDEIEKLAEEQYSSRIGTMNGTDNNYWERAAFIKGCKAILNIKIK